MQVEQTNPLLKQTFYSEHHNSGVGKELTLVKQQEEEKLLRAPQIDRDDKNNSLNQKDDPKESQSVQDNQKSLNGELLSPRDLEVVKQLQQRDKEVKAHEQAHKAAGGQYASAPSYEYQSGPDGKRYAIGGEVRIDTGKENDPKETLKKAEVIQRAALAPQEPSAQDRRVASKAAQMQVEARQEIFTDQREMRHEKSEEIKENSEQHDENSTTRYDSENSTQNSSPIENNFTDLIESASTTNQLTPFENGVSLPANQVDRTPSSEIAQHTTYDQHALMSGKSLSSGQSINFTA